MDLNRSRGDPYYMLLTDPLLSIVDNSLHHSKYLLAPGAIAIREAFSCFSKLAGAFVFWYSGVSQIKSRFLGTHVSGSETLNSIGQVKHSTSSNNYHYVGNQSCFRFPHESFATLFGHKISAFSIEQFFRAADYIQPIPVFSLAAAVIPPLDHL